MSPTELAQLRTGAEEDLSAHLVEGGDRELHEVKRIVGNDGVLQARGLTDRESIRVEHVHREQDDFLLLLAREGIEPPAQRLFATPVADPEGLARIEIADDGHEA